MESKKEAAPPWSGKYETVDGKRKKKKEGVDDFLGADDAVVDGIVVADPAHAATDIEVIHRQVEKNKGITDWAMKRLKAGKQTAEELDVARELGLLGLAVPELLGRAPGQ